MKDERAKYLIVDASDVTKQLYQVERIAYCNDFDNIYHRTEKISANDIFANNSIPDQFRKIIVKISNPVFSKKEAEEYLTRFSFDFRSKSIKDNNNKKYITMHNIPIYYNGSIFDDKIIISTKVNYTSYNNVMYLLEEIYNEGYLDNYIKSIKELFDMSLDLGLLFEAWNETHNKEKVLKI